jgi:ornithine cyclodeaminase/alanine dehydrogenase-like protein (mu-crystallin family)
MVDRRLVLRREQLTELTTNELGDVVAGAAPTKTCPDYTYYCITGPAICDLSRVTCP